MVQRLIPLVVTPLPPPESHSCEGDVLLLPSPKVKERPEDTHALATGGPPPKFLLARKDIRRLEDRFLTLPEFMLLMEEVAAVVCGSEGVGLARSSCRSVPH